MTWKLCAVGMHIAILGNNLNIMLMTGLYDYKPIWGMYLLHA